MSIYVMRKEVGRKVICTRCKYWQLILGHQLIVASHPLDLRSDNETSFGMHFLNRIQPHVHILFVFKSLWPFVTPTICLTQICISRIDLQTWWDTDTAWFKLQFEKGLLLTQPPILKCQEKEPIGLLMELRHTLSFTFSLAHSLAFSLLAVT